MIKSLNQNILLIDLPMGNRQEKLWPRKKPRPSILPNLFTTSRVGITFAAEATIWPHLNEIQSDFTIDLIIFLVLLLISFYLDGKDGDYARRLDSPTRLGHLLDRFADAANFAALGSTIVALTLQ